ncbi:phosphoglycerate mutase [Lysobacter pythonis]|uniref:Phosphoglycerate mutase n=1 Tax=Solilutibacter pythonis TaxID=2483112 RepID=A0A3M2I5B9_9GAMM|nr:phosphoglycerate mutase [Lysobacter pythonis]RMH94749.1 phosphoglycerate mutase [Lysobacter pythonis]
MSAAGVHLLLPPPRRWPRPWPGAVARALGRAERFGQAPDAVIAALFGLRALPASAALARLGEGDIDIDTLRAHRWLRADPAWIRADINGARLCGIGPMLALGAEEADAFAAGLRAMFADAGHALEVVAPTRWYLRLPRDAELPHLATPVEALGEDVFDHRPEGTDARAWRALESEAQVGLHQHPRNAMRVRAGLPPVNALWFWGGEALPDMARAGLSGLASDDPLLRGAAGLAGIPLAPLPARWPAAAGLYDLRGIRAGALYADWLLPALDAMRTEKFVMQWVCEEGPVFELRPSQRWRFWRKPLGALETPTDTGEGER